LAIRVGKTGQVGQSYQCPRKARQLSSINMELIHDWIIVSLTNILLLPVVNYPIDA